MCQVVGEREVQIARAGQCDRRRLDGGGAAVDGEVAFAQAAVMEESDIFQSVADPPAWYYPVRRDVAEALAAQNDFTGARREAQAALKYRPRDPGTMALLSKLDARSAAR